MNKPILFAILFVSSRALSSPANSLIAVNGVNTLYFKQNAIIQTSEASYDEIVSSGQSAWSFVNRLDLNTQNLLAHRTLLGDPRDKTWVFERPMDVTLDYLPSQSRRIIGRMPSIKAALSSDIEYYVRLAKSSSDGGLERQLIVAFDEDGNGLAVYRVERNSYELRLVLPALLQIELEKLPPGDPLVRLLKGRKLSDRDRVTVDTRYGQASFHEDLPRICERAFRMKW